MVELHRRTNERTPGKRYAISPITWTSCVTFPDSIGNLISFITSMSIYLTVPCAAAALISVVRKLNRSYPMSVLGDKIARTIGRAIVKLINEDPDMWKKIVMSAGTLVAGGTAYAFTACKNMVSEVKEGIKELEIKMQMEEERRIFHEKLIETQTRLLQQILSGQQANKADTHKVVGFCKSLENIQDPDETQASIRVYKWFKAMCEECTNNNFESVLPKEGLKDKSNFETCMLSKLFDVCNGIV